MLYSYKILRKENVSEILLTQLPEQAGVAAKIFSLIAEKGINVVLIQHIYTGTVGGDAAVFVARDDVSDAFAILERHKGQIGVQTVAKKEGFTLLSICSHESRSHKNFCLDIHRALCRESIPVEIFSLAGSNINVVLPENQVEPAMSSFERFLGEPIISLV